MADKLEEKKIPEEKYCPLCAEILACDGSCAWYIESGRAVPMVGCAVVVIARSLFELNADGIRTFPE